MNEPEYVPYQKYGEGLSDQFVTTFNEKAQAENTKRFTEWQAKEAAAVPSVTLPDVPISAVFGLEEFDDGTQSGEHRYESYINMVREGEMDRIRYAGPGQRNNNVFQAACSLIEHANSDWNDYTVEQAAQDIKTASDAIISAGKDGYTRTEVATSWKSAVRKIGRKGRDNPPSDDQLPLIGETFTKEQWEAYLEAKKDYAQETTEGGLTSTTGAPEETEESESSVPEIESTEFFSLLETGPSINWRDLVPDGTFLKSYMKECCIDDSPEEFHLFAGLQALGLAVGRTVRIMESKPVLANLYCLRVAGTSERKSTADGPLKMVISDALSDSGLNRGKGARERNKFGSPEALIKQGLMDTGVDTSALTGQPYERYWPRRLILMYDEFATLIPKTSQDRFEGLKQVITEAFDGGTLRHIVVSGETEARDYFCSMTGNIPLKTARDLLQVSQVHSGFLNRYIPVFGNIKTRAYKVPPYNMANPTWYLKEIKAYYEMLVISQCSGWPEQDAPTFKEMPWIGLEWDSAADQRMMEFWRDSVHPFQMMSAESGYSLAHRADLVMKKLALLSAINSKRGCIEIEDVEFAKALFPYLRYCYGVLEENVGIRESVDLQNAVTEAIDSVLTSVNSRFRAAQTLGAVSIMHMQRSKPSLRKIPDWEIVRTLETLEATGKVESVTPPKSGPGKGGRPLKGDRLWRRKEEI